MILTREEMSVIISDSLKPFLLEHQQPIPEAEWDLIFSVIAEIEKLGYHVTLASHQCQIYDKNWKMIIDADFYNTFKENTLDGVNAFITWDKRKK